MLAHEKIGTVELALDQVLFRASLLSRKDNISIISVACWSYVVVNQALMFMHTFADQGICILLYRFGYNPVCSHIFLIYRCV
jgi:hypothetical protein